VEVQNVPCVDTPTACVFIHTINSRDVISALTADGWFEVNRVGSHAQFKHDTKKGRVTVPHRAKDIPMGTLKSSENQAGPRLRGI
jgi:predicted RNA binding protein YcfA (HicA-like mRNA interferase family)